jgi:hypothetical protein
MTRYPIYLPTKGRWQPERAMTARCLAEQAVPFKLAVEPQEADDYAAEWGEDRLLVLPFSDLGEGPTPARAWIKDHAAAEGHDRHWQLDDNMSGFHRAYRGKRIKCPADHALSVVEDFTERYENVGVSGLNYSWFLFSDQRPIRVNGHVYSAMLVNNEMPGNFRGRYQEDCDMCLQAFAGGWCTLLFNTVLANKAVTMTVPGGNTDELYAKYGRVRHGEGLEKRWPGIASTKERYGRTTHHVDWGKIGPKLRLKPGLSLDPKPPDERGVRLQAVGEVKSPRLRQLLTESG